MDGILIVKKEKEYTSHDVVAKVKRLTKEKVGHTGTLDPMATGVLPLLIGDGTKLSKYLINHDKIYEATVKLGKKTSTGDSEGDIIEEKKINESLLEERNIQKVLKNLEGKQLQTPPIYSAIKINGKKLYEYARQGQQVDIKPREIEIYNMELINIDLTEKIVNFKVHCSKGTYIRTLCEQIAQKLGTVGYMKELNRIKVGEFSIEQSVSLNQIEENLNNISFWKEHLITIEKFFEDKKSIILDDYKLGLFLNGVQLTRKETDGIYRITDENNMFIGIGTIKNNLLKRDIVLNSNANI